jgi:hypothetical protein
MPESPDVEALLRCVRSLRSWLAHPIVCTDCDPFRESPAQEFRHHKDCGVVEALNQANVLLGEPPLSEKDCHAFEDPGHEMRRLAAERLRVLYEGGLISEPPSKCKMCGGRGIKPDYCKCDHPLAWHIGPNGVGLGYGPACHCGCETFEAATMVLSVFSANRCEFCMGREVK